MARRREQRSPDDERATRLLLACLRHGVPGPFVGAIDPGDEERLLVLGARHGVNPILHQRLPELRAAGLTLSPEGERELRLAYHHSRLRARAVRGEMAEVLRALVDAGVPVLALKGAYMAEHVYGDAALRPMLDLDLLVPDDRAPDAARAILGLGYAWDDATRTVDYAGHQHLRRLLRPGRLPVELHRALAPRTAAWRLDVRAVWAGARRTRVAGVEVLCLSPEHRLLHLIVHAASHGFVVPLLMIEDVARVAETLGTGEVWRRFVAAAGAADAGRLAWTTLMLARTLLGARLDDEALAPLAHTPDDAVVLPALARTVLDPEAPLPTGWARALAQRGTWTRLAFLAGRLLPSPRDVRAQRALVGWSPALAWYYIARPLDLVRRHGRALVSRLRARHRPDGRVAVERWLRAASHPTPPAAGPAGRDDTSVLPTIAAAPGFAGAPGPGSVRPAIFAGRLVTLDREADGAM